MKDRGLLGSCRTGLSSVLTSVLARCRSSKGDVICFKHRGSLLTIVTVGSRLQIASVRTVQRLHVRSVRVYVLAKSNRHATSSITNDLNVVHFITSTVPSSGRSFVRGLRLRNGAITVMNSNIGSTRTLDYTSMDVTVKGKASALVSATVVALEASSLLLLPGIFQLSHRAIDLVCQGLF